MTTDGTLSGGEPLGDDPPWDAWHPAELARRLAGVATPWSVAAGRAVDLWHGRTTLLPTFDRERRGWLADALRRVHPGHAWIDLVEP